MCKKLSAGDVGSRCSQPAGQVPQGTLGNMRGRATNRCVCAKARRLRTTILRGTRGAAMRRVLVLSLILLALASGVAFAQYTGTIRGVVTDPAGAVVAGAQVTAINAANNDTRSTTTNGEGEYVFTALPPATYEIHVKQGSFAEFIAKAVELHVSSTYEANAQLKMAKASGEQITVEANAVQVQNDDASIGTVIEGQQVTELPLNGRSFK